MKESSVIENAVTFMCRHTYLVDRDTGKEDFLGCPDLCSQQEEHIFTVIKGLSNERT